MKLRCRIYKNGKKVFDKTKDIIIHNGSLVYNIEKSIALKNGDYITIGEV